MTKIIFNLVTCNRCGKEKQVTKQVYLERIYKVIIKQYNVSYGDAKNIPMDDERFITAKTTLDTAYICRKCKGPYVRDRVKVPVLLENGEKTTDYYEAFPEAFK